MSCRSRHAPAVWRQHGKPQRGKKKKSWGETVVSWVPAISTAVNENWWLLGCLKSVTLLHTPLSPNYKPGSLPVQGPCCQQPQSNLQREIAEQQTEVPPRQIKAELWEQSKAPVILLIKSHLAFQQMSQDTNRIKGYISSHYLHREYPCHFQTWLRRALKGRDCSFWGFWMYCVGRCRRESKTLDKKGKNLIRYKCSVSDNGLLSVCKIPVQIPTAGEDP